MATQTVPLEIRLTDPHAFRVVSAGGTPVLEVDTLTLALKLSGRLMLNGIDIGPRQQFFQGNTVEPPDTTVTSDGTTITLAVAATGGGGLTLIFADGHYDWPAGSVTLTAGTDTVPRLNFIYIPYSTKILTVSTTSFPHTGEEFIPIAMVVVQSAVTVQADGALRVCGHTMLVNLAGQGHLTHINEWINQQHSAWHSGVAQTLTITPQGGAADNIDFATTAGIAYQIHSETLPAFDTATGTEVRVVNDFTTPYTKITDLNALLTDSANVSMATRYFNLVIWASISEDENDCHLFVNLPGGSYVKQSDALADVTGYTNFAIPVAFRGAAILISRLTLRHQAAAFGTWTLIRHTDLRGSIPNIIAGGGTQAITTEFADSTFRLFDETDPTKLTAFELAGITTGNTRTLTVPDASGTIALTSGLHVPVTLAPDADVLLDLVGQQLQLDSQAANLIFGGPAAGGPADPTFRALVDADIPAGVMRDAEHLALGAAAPHHAQLHGAADHNAAVLAAAFNENLGAFYLDIDDIAVPANPAITVRRLFVNQATGELSVRTNAGATVSLEAGAGGVAAHNLLDGVVHLDTILQGCSRGSLIYGTSGLQWDEFIVGAVGTFLRADAVDVYYGLILDADIPAIHSGTAHHIKYTNLEAVTAVEAEDPLDLAGVVNFAQYADFAEIAAPAAPAANKLRVYAKDVGGASLPLFQNSEGIETTLVGIGRPLRTTYWHYDDLLNWSGDIIGGILNQTAGGVGAGWSNALAEASHLGIWYAVTGTTATGHPRLSSMADSIMFSNGKIRFGAVVKTGPTLSTAAQRYQLYAGILNNHPDVSTNGMMLQYSDNINGGKWRGRVKNAGGVADLNTAVVAVINTWYFLEMEINAAGDNVDFWINGAYMGNVPSGPAVNCTAEIRTGILKSVGGASRGASWDAYYLYGEMTAAR